MFSRRLVAYTGLATAIAFLLLGTLHLTADSNSTRTISIHNIHTKETVTVVYKRAGRYVPEGMKKVNWVMRDWRADEPAKMDPKLIDILWEMHAELGSREPIHLISGYRSKATNDKLRRMRGGQARKSQHILGKAADVHFPDVPIKRLRYSALIRQRGGVGYYPTSSIPFVHVDTGRVRHWPRMPRYELALLFPNGKSRHIPAGGRRITREDVRIASTKHKPLASQVAQFFADRGKAARAPTLVASAKPARKARTRLAKIAAANVPAPKPARLRRAVNRPERFVPEPTPSPSDRARLDQLVQLAAFTPDPRPRLRQRPTLAKRPVAPTPAKPAALKAAQAPAAMASVNPLTLMRQLAPSPDSSTAENSRRPAPPVTDLESPSVADSVASSRFGWSNGWANAPAFDDEHPDELSYRPYPLAPMLTQTASVDDATLITLTAPEMGQVGELLLDDGPRVSMRFGPPLGAGAQLLTQQFAGPAAQRASVGEERNARLGLRTAIR